MFESVAEQSVFSSLPGTILSNDDDAKAPLLKPRGLLDKFAYLANIGYADESIDEPPIFGTDDWSVDLMTPSVELVTESRRVLKLPQSHRRPYQLRRQAQLMEKLL